MYVCLSTHEVGASHVDRCGGLNTSELWKQDPWPPKAKKGEEAKEAEKVEPEEKDPEGEEEEDSGA